MFCISLRSFSLVCGTTYIVMGKSGTVTTSFPPPVIHDSNVLSLPRFMFTPSYVFTPSPPSHFSFTHSLPPPCLIHGAGSYYDRTTAPSLPLLKPHFHEPNPPEGLHHFCDSDFMQSGVGGAFQGEGSRLQCCTSVSYFCATH